MLITGKLDYAKTSSQLKKDLKNLKQNINLIGTIDKSKLKKDVQAAVSQVQVAPKINTGALQKQIEKVSINPNVAIYICHILPPYRFGKLLYLLVKAV